MCNDIALLPEALRAKSLSQAEIVLPYPEILEAIDHIAGQGHAFLGWEGWLRYADGRHGHSAVCQGTVSLEQRHGETWESYATWSAELCRRTVQQDRDTWSASDESRVAELFFCITVCRRETAKS